VRNKAIAYLRSIVEFALLVVIVAKVDISSKDGESIMKIATSHAFAAESDAQVFGFQMGKNWIDKH
jgi:hypothetical protein